MQPAEDETEEQMVARIEREERERWEDEEGPTVSLTHASQEDVVDLKEIAKRFGFLGALMDPARPGPTVQHTSLVPWPASALSLRRD